MSSAANQVTYVCLKLVVVAVAAAALLEVALQLLQLPKRRVTPTLKAHTHTHRGTETRMEQLASSPISDALQPPLFTLLSSRLLSCIVQYSPQFAVSVLAASVAVAVAASAAVAVCLPHWVTLGHCS